MNNLIALRIIRTIVNSIVGEEDALNNSLPNRRIATRHYKLAKAIQKLLIKDGINEN